MRETALTVFVGLFTSSLAFCQTEVMKSVVNNLAYYKQKGDIKYLGSAKKSIDSLITNKADSADLQKSVYRILVNSSILYIDSLNKLKQSPKLFDQTVDLIDKTAKNKRSYRYQPELDFSKRCISNVYVRRGFRYLYNSDFANAERVFEKARSYTPAYPQINAYIAYTAGKQGNVQRSAQYYNNLVTADSTKADYFIVASNTYELAGDTAKALSIVKRGRKLVPGDRFLLFEEANIYCNQKNYKAFASLIKTLLDINPNNYDIAFASANCYDHLSQFDKAESLYLHAIELNSTAYEPVFNLGLLYLRESSGHNAEKNIGYAAQWLDKANEMSPNDLKCLQLLQMVYAKSGNEAQLKQTNNKIKNLTNQQ